MSQDKIEERIKAIEAKARKILEEKLPSLPYFNDANYTSNSKTLRKVVLTGSNSLMDYGQFAMYWPSKNVLTVDERSINDEVSDDFLVMFMIHELIHMASTDLKRMASGFQGSGLPASYNEALTQWLTLKIFLGDEHINESVERNTIYPESVNRAHEMVSELGEEVVFNGFFKADIKANVKALDENQKSKWLDNIVKFHSSNEEKTIQESIGAIYRDFGEDREENSNNHDDVEH